MDYTIKDRWLEGAYFEAKPNYAYARNVAASEDLQGLIPTQETNRNYTNSTAVKKTARIVLGEVIMELFNLEKLLESLNPHDPPEPQPPFSFSIRKLTDTPDISGFVKSNEYRKRYTALAIISPGLTTMARDGSVVPEVIGSRFDQIYQIMLE
ncbi:MAG: hypothetical protein AABX04_00505 [Nanoarchaeota archaeon]